MKNILLIFIGLFLFGGCASIEKEQASSQVFEIPKNYSFETENDYKKYEVDILKCIEYLENAPVNDLSDNRQKINTFFLEWLSGVPYVHVKIDNTVLEICRENPNFLMIFMGGWTKYTLLHLEDQNEVNGFLAGIEAVLDVYRKGNDVKTDEKILALIKIQDEGRLKDLIQQR